MIESIPEGWGKTTVQDCCDILDSQRVPITKLKREAGTVPYYGATGCLDYVKNHIFDEELVLVGEDGADWSGYANTAFIIEGKSWVNNHAHVLRCRNINSIFLRDFLNMNDLRMYINGTTRGKLNQEALRKISVLLPPLPEQEKIALILSKTDEQIQLTEEIIAKTEELKKGLMQQLLTKGIGHTKVKNSPFGNIHADWEVLSIQSLLDEKSIVSHLDGNHGAKYPKSNEFKKEGVKYLSANSLLNGYFADLSLVKFLSLERAKQFTKGISIDGDVLLAHNATVGPAAILKTKDDFVILSTTVTYYRCNLKTLNNFYLLYFFQSSFFQKQLHKIMKQATRNQVPITTQRKFYVIVPPLNEQKKIASILSATNKEIEYNKFELKKLNELKKGLMQDLLTGKVRVTNLMKKGVVA